MIEIKEPEALTKESYGVFVSTLGMLVGAIRPNMFGEYKYLALGGLFMLNAEDLRGIANKIDELNNKEESDARA